jgi:hypothetical protein
VPTATTPPAEGPDGMPDFKQSNHTQDGMDGKEEEGKRKVQKKKGGDMSEEEGEGGEVQKSKRKVQKKKEESKRRDLSYGGHGFI